MGKILLVGGSSGIGNAILKRISKHTESVVISRSAPEETFSNSNHYSCDVLSDPLPELSEISSIIYCPGSINLKPIGSLKEQDFKNDFEINVIGAVKVIKQYLKQLKNASNPSILLFSTVAVNQGMPFHSSVAAAKGAVEGLAKSLAAELAPKVRVNCIAPSITDTPLAAGILRNEKSIENIKAKHPLKKILSPDEIAGLAEFLISENAAGITGQILGVDAGLSNLKI